MAATIYTVPKEIPFKGKLFFAWAPGRPDIVAVRSRDAVGHVLARVRIKIQHVKHPACQ